MKKKKQIMACDTPPYIAARHAQEMVNYEYQLSCLAAAQEFLNKVPFVDGVSSMVDKIRNIRMIIYMLNAIRDTSAERTVLQWIIDWVRVRHNLPSRIARSAYDR